MWYLIALWRERLLKSVFYKFLNFSDKDMRMANKKKNEENILESNYFN